MRGLWRVSLLLVLNCSLLNKECNLLNVLKFKLYCDQWSVGQFVLMSCPFWSGWPDVTFLWETITYFLFHVGRPLWREDGSVICSAMTQVQFHVIFQPTVCRSVCLGAEPDQILISLFDNYFLFFPGVGLPHPYPHEQGDPARSQSQSHSYISVG
jgi:hypothetical protein